MGLRRLGLGFAVLALLVAPVVAAIGAFVALTPTGDAPALARLADACVATFDRFRAPASEFIFLPARFGLNPVVPAYRYSDQTFGLVVDWTIGALIEAGAPFPPELNASGEPKVRTPIAAGVPAPGFSTHSSTAAATGPGETPNGGCPA